MPEPTHTPVEADYLVVGSGATGMAFADTMLSESDARIIMVDIEPQPGGHWLHAYPFVTLHQPSRFYGIASMELGNGQIDTDGLNAGMYSLASGSEIIAYYQQAMARFVATGRLQFWPNTRYLHTSASDQSSLQSVTNGTERLVTTRRAVVDATWMQPNIPARHKPGFTVAGNATLVPVNAVPEQLDAPAFAVLGGGKTGIDACLYLMQHGIDPDRITWVIPNDAWLLDRANTQPGADFFDQTVGSLANQYEAIASATSVDDLFDRLHACGYLLCLDESHRPSVFRAATVSRDELAQLRRINRVVRLGRVTRVEPGQLVLEQGTCAVPAGTLSVDCTASAIAHKRSRPIFAPGHITPQLVRAYQPTFSASLIAWVEAHYPGDNKPTDDAVIAEKNGLCQVVSVPDRDTDFIRFTAASMTNQYTWTLNKSLRAWIAGNRLDGFGRANYASLEMTDARKQILDRVSASTMPAAMKLRQFIAELESGG